MFNMAQTQEVQKMIDNSLDKAKESKDMECKLHVERLNAFEGNQKELIKEVQAGNKLLAVVADNMADMKETREKLFSIAHKNALNIATNKIDSENVEKRVKEIEDSNKNSTTLKWTTAGAIALAILEYFLNRKP